MMKRIWELITTSWQIEHERIQAFLFNLPRTLKKPGSSFGGGGCGSVFIVKREQAIAMMLALAMEACSSSAPSNGHAADSPLKIVFTGSISQLLSRIGGLLADDALARKTAYRYLVLAKRMRIFFQTIRDPGVRGSRYSAIPHRVERASESQKGMETTFLSAP